MSDQNPNGVPNPPSGANPNIPNGVSQPQPRTNTTPPSQAIPPSARQPQSAPLPAATVPQNTPVQPQPRNPQTVPPIPNNNQSPSLPPLQVHAAATNSPSVSPATGQQFSDYLDSPPPPDFEAVLKQKYHLFRDIGVLIPILLIIPALIFLPKNQTAFILEGVFLGIWALWSILQRGSFSGGFFVSSIVTFSTFLFLKRETNLWGIPSDFYQNTDFLVSLPAKMTPLLSDKSIVIPLGIFFGLWLIGWLLFRKFTRGFVTAFILLPAIAVGFAFYQGTQAALLDSVTERYQKFISLLDDSSGAVSNDINEGDQSDDTSTNESDTNDEDDTSINESDTNDEDDTSINESDTNDEDGTSTNESDTNDEDPTVTDDKDGTDPLDSPTDASPQEDLPDLIVDTIDWTIDNTPDGRKVVFNIHVKNIGHNAIPTTSVSITTSDWQGKITPSETANHMSKNIALASGEKDIFNVIAMLPPEESEVSFFIEVDPTTSEKPQGLILESEESNNIARTNIFKVGVSSFEEETTTCDFIYQPVCGEQKKTLCEKGEDCQEMITFRNQCDLNSSGATLVHDGICTQNITNCSQEYTPVCGTVTSSDCDDETTCPLSEKTFSNRCVLEEAEAKFVYEGECNREIKQEAEPATDE
jgi:hypothetical protein